MSFRKEVAYIIFSTLACGMVFLPIYYSVVWHLFK